MLCYKPSLKLISKSQLGICPFPVTHSLMRRISDHGFLFHLETRTSSILDNSMQTNSAVLSQI